VLEWLLRRRRLLLLLQLAPAALAVRSRLRLLLLLQLAGAAPAARSHSAALVRHRSAASHVGARLIARYSARHSAQQRRPLTPPIGPSKDEFASNAGGLRASHTMLDKSLPRCDPGKRSRRSLRTANVRGVRFATPFRPPSWPGTIADTCRGALCLSHDIRHKSLSRCDPGKRSRRSLLTANVRGMRFSTPFRPPSWPATIVDTCRGVLCLSHDVRHKSCQGVTLASVRAVACARRTCEG
jgi:hypothetical protein